MNSITESVRQLPGTSVKQVPDLEHVLVTARTGVPPPASSWGESGGPKHHPQRPCYLDCLQVVEVDDAVLNGSRDQGGFRSCRTPDRRILRAHPLQVCAHRGGRDV